MVDPLESSPSGASSTVEDTGDTVKSPPSVGAGLVAIFSWFPDGRKRGCSRIIISLSSTRRTNLQLQLRNKELYATPKKGLTITSSSVAHPIHYRNTRYEIKT